MSTSHLSLVDTGTPAIDYEAVKEFFFSKLERDRVGKYRMESALFHTTQWIFMQGCHEREQLLARIAALEADNVILRQALNTTAAGAAELLLAAQRWVSVGESLPDDGLDVIVTDGIEVWSAFHEGDVWKFWSGETFDTIVTNWMDFPKGPRDA